jgi:hypothetical protein
MGCKPFLGEEIAELTKPRIDRDHLAIEIAEASKADLILMFLGSPGTYSELTAFALDRSINHKTVVFNDIAFADAKSFINLGPMKLLPRSNVIYYDPDAVAWSPEFIWKIDVIVARKWFEVSKIGAGFPKPIGFEEFACLCCIYAAFPVRYAELEELVPFGRSLSDRLKTLFGRGLIATEEKMYVPRQPLVELPVPGRCANDIARVRMALMDRRLRNDERVSDYRMIM